LNAKGHSIVPVPTYLPNEVTSTAVFVADCVFIAGVWIWWKS